MTTTPTSPSRRSLLPLAGRQAPAHPGGRSATVCHYRCANACLQPVPNTSDNAYFGDVLTSSLSRRRVLAAVGLLAGAATVGRSVLSAPSAAAADGATAAGATGATGATGRGLAFTPIAPVPATVDAVTVPDGYVWRTIISWGDPVLADAPEFDFDHQTPEAQAGQFGYNNDYTTLIPTGPNRALLVCNHEYTNEELMFRGWPGEDAATVDQLRIAMLAHGMTVVRLRRSGRDWVPVVGSKVNRRVTTDTRFLLTGPAAGSAYLRTSRDRTGRYAFGTLNNCAGGTTPWGTVLSGEENFNQYFRVEAEPADARTAAGYARYGITEGTGRNWFRADDRFDTAVEPNEPHRFGWIVEIDPRRPGSTPRKHTALGRFKHEGATIALSADGHAVAYMGDDERYDYMYKFVSARAMVPGGSEKARKQNMTLLEEGDLFVARFDGDPSPTYDGRGEWLPLVVDNASRVPGMSVEDVLVWTRLAADAVGATKMDRPEDVQPSPVSGKVYAALTNNSRRLPGEVDGPNPRPENKFGQVLEIHEDDDDAAAATFSWKLLVVAGDPADPSTYFSGIDPSEVSPISCPDNVAFDRRGNLLVSTDGQPDSLGLDDALHVVPVEGPDRGKVQQFLAVPTGAETCGPLVTFDEQSVLVAVQHPGDVEGASPDAPASVFPYDGTGQPRPSVIQVRRADGGRVI